MAKLSKGLAVSDATHLKVVVYWGDVLYDTIICAPARALNVGRLPQNRIVIPMDEMVTSRDSLELFKVNKDGTADLTFDESIGGYAFLGGKFKRLAAIIDGGKTDRQPDGTHTMRITKGDRGEFVLGHLTFSYEWVKEFVPIHRMDLAGQKKGLLIRTAIGAAVMLLSFLVYVLEPAEEPPPERLVKIIPKYRPPPKARAAVGKPKTKDGGSKKGAEGVAKAKPKPKPTEAEMLEKELSGDLVKDLADIGNISPDRTTATKEDATLDAVLDQAATGGTSTKGFKTGGGGKSAGIGRTVGQGEGGFAGTGRLGLSGNAAVETSSGRGGYETEWQGGLDRDVIDSIVRKKQNRIRLCYERQLNFKPDLAGKVTVHFVIGGDGRVLQSSIAEDTMRNRSVNQCILAEVKNWIFPRPKGGTKVEVDYPFVFESSIK